MGAPAHRPAAVTVGSGGPRSLRGTPASAGAGSGPVAHLPLPPRPPGLAPPVILVVDDLRPDEVASLDPAAVAGIACAGGAPLAHGTILARSLGIPAVTGLGRAVREVAAGTVLLVDGDEGTVEVDPGPVAVEAVESRRAERRRLELDHRRAAGAPAATRDGHPVEVLANAGGAADAAAAVGAGADGVGMLRTEFAFLGRAHAPDEEEQYRAYRAVADALDGRPLVIRTLDLGADIPVWGGETEPNPALGNRGIRLSLSVPALLETQLRAVARLAREREVSVMFPMVTTVEELARARGYLEAAGAGAATKVGVTVEVPAAAVMADAFAPLVDFFAVGTNDLTQYTLAADRANASVAALADGLHPAVLRLLRMVTAAGERHGRPVEVVGELATDPLGAPVLIGLGVSALSVRPNAVPSVKHLVRQLTITGARSLAASALDATTADEVRRLAARAGEG